MVQMGPLEEIRMSVWDIALDVDTVLRCQGADPLVLRERNPRLVDLTERAIEEGAAFLNPSVHQHRRKVLGFTHPELLLDGGASIAGELISQHLPAASEVVAVLCTIGPELEAHAAQALARDPAFGLALDGVGSAAVEVLAQSICSEADSHARIAGQQTTIPFSPGMMGWPLEEGQAQLFALWRDESIDIRLTESFMMVPSKSISMLIGIGADVQQVGRPCDYCSERETCRYQDQHA
jgi:hypothetical protein